MVPIERWRELGRSVDTPDGRVFAVELGEGTDADAVPVVLLHGFPTSSWDFAEVATRLADRRRVLTFDFLGYGLSDKPADHGYSLFEQADVAIEVLRACGLKRAHLFAHDMGTSVVTELCARRERGLLPFEIASVALMNGSVHVEMASLTFGQHLLRSPLGAALAKVSSAALFKAQIRRVFGRPPDEATLDAMWALLAREDGAARLPSLIRYIEERARFRRRWIGALERLDLPALVCWGRLDPVALHAIARELAAEIPGAELATWDDLGHYPQVESPATVVATVSAFWDRVGSPRAT